MFKRLITAFLITFLMISLGSCQNKTGSDRIDSEADSEGTEKPKLTLTSPVFKDKLKIPERYSCDGEDLSPLLQWNEPPAGTRSFALICDDPDAPGGDWVHWVIYNIPGTQRNLDENIPDIDQFENGIRQGRNDFRRIGYGGPCPPPGKSHRYFFRLYALDVVIGLEPGTTKSELKKAIKSHILAETHLMGKYQR